MQSPYSTSLGPDGYHRFVTDHGISYGCAFSPVDIPLEHDAEVNEFLFYPDSSTGPDPRVSVTIAELMKGYFTRPDKVLIYICDARDGRWQARQRLFKQWHHNMGDMFNRYDLDIVVGQAVAHGGVLVRKDYPYPMDLKGPGVVVEKFGG